MQLFQATMFVTVYASHAVKTLLGQVERPAVLALVLVNVDSKSGLSQFLLTMSKSTLKFIPAMSSLNPVFAHLRFVLPISINFSVLWGLDGGLAGLGLAWVHGLWTKAWLAGLVGRLEWLWLEASRSEFTTRCGWLLKGVAAALEAVLHVLLLVSHLWLKR